MDMITPALVFLVTCFDTAEAPVLRDELLGAHLAHVEAHYERIAVAGPIPDGPGGGFTSSLFIVRAESEEDAMAFIRTDPYHAGGVYERCEVQPFQAVFGTWPGGKSWESIAAAEARAQARLRARGTTSPSD